MKSSKSSLDKTYLLHLQKFVISLSPTSKESREVANWTGRKNLLTPVYSVKDFVCLSSVCYNIFPAEHGNKKLQFLTFLWDPWSTKNFLFVRNRLKSNFNAKITTQSCTIHLGVWNLPHKFHLYLILLSKVVSCC